MTFVLLFFDSAEIRGQYTYWRGGTVCFQGEPERVYEDARVDAGIKCKVQCRPMAIACGIYCKSSLPAWYRHILPQSSARSLTFWVIDFFIRRIPEQRDIKHPVACCLMKLPCSCHQKYTRFLVFGRFVAFSYKIRSSPKGWAPSRTNSAGNSFLYSFWYARLDHFSTALLRAPFCCAGDSKGKEKLGNKGNQPPIRCPFRSTKLRAKDDKRFYW